MRVIGFKYIIQVKSLSTLIVLIGLFLMSGCNKEENISNLPDNEKKIFREKIASIGTSEKVSTNTVSDEKEEMPRKQTDILSASETNISADINHNLGSKKESEEKTGQLIKEIRLELLSSGEEKVLFFMKGSDKRDLFALEGTPPRIVCDFFAAKIADNVRKQVDLDGKIIKKLRIGIHKDQEPRVRVVLELAVRERNDYEVQPISYNDADIFAIVIK